MNNHVGVSLMDGKYSLHHDSVQWVLRKHSTGKSKKGEIIYTYQASYHGTLLQAANYILDVEAKSDTGEIEALIEFMERAARIFEKNIESEFAKVNSNE